MNALAYNENSQIKANVQVGRIFKFLKTIVATGAIPYLLASFTRWCGGLNNDATVARWS
jgi:hypothetical protein